MACVCACVCMYVQGAANDCWLIAAMNCITASPTFARFADGERLRALEVTAVQGSSNAVDSGTGSSGGSSSASGGSSSGVRDFLIKPPSPSDPGVVDRANAVDAIRSGAQFQCRVRLVDITADEANPDVVWDPMRPRLVTVSVNNTFPVRREVQGGSEKVAIVYADDDNVWANTVEKAVALHRCLSLLEYRSRVAAGSGGNDVSLLGRGDRGGVR